MGQDWGSLLDRPSPLDVDIATKQLSIDSSLSKRAAALAVANITNRRMGRDMIGIHTPSGLIISPTLISSERYKWLHAAHSQRARTEAFNQDLLKLLARYHPRAKSPNP